MDSDIPRLAPAAPVSSNERIQLLDVLRGYALWGVLMSNVYVWFSGRHHMPQERLKEFSTQTFHIVLQILQNQLIAGKFITIFAFLFGLGLAVQFGRAEERNDSLVKRYARRAAALAGFGLVHLTAIWYGDVLFFYAQIGLLVMLFRRVSPRKLLILGAFLTMIYPILFNWGIHFLPKLWTSKEALAAAEKADMARTAEQHAQLLSAWSGNSYLAIIKANVQDYIDFFFNRMSLLTYLEVFGKMLLGFYAGKIRLFHDAEAKGKTFRRLFAWSLPIAILTTATSLSLRYIFKVPPGSEQPLYRQILTPVVWNVQITAMACFYVSALALLFLRPTGRRVLSIFAPVGRMALTNYLMHSVVGLFYFSGLGFGRIGKLTLLDTHVYPTCLFAFQIVASRIWLQHFEFGPVEWLWRYFTYGTKSRMRKVPKQLPSAAAA